MTLTLLLLVGAFVCFALAAFGVPSRVGLVPAGLALLVLTQLLQMAKKPITGMAALADGRTCLGCDRDGEWRLMLILPAEEGKALAQRIDELRDVSFGFAFTPIKP